MSWSHASKQDAGGRDKRGHDDRVEPDRRTFSQSI